MAKKSEKPAKFAPSMAENPKPDDKWQAEDDARTLMRAGEIHMDPTRHKKAMMHLGKQKKAITSIEQLRKHSNEMAAKKRMGMDDQDGDE